MPSKYYRLSNIDRLKIEDYLGRGLNLNQIAKKIGFHRSSILREVNRN